ncbi:MAG TPA: thioredoxin domain-containing protein [Actinocrinis sp.]|jgi:protein-disulfide isomerase
MSKSNRVGKELARQRAQQLREEQAKRTRRNRQYMVFGGVIAVIVVVALVAVLVQVHNANQALKYIPSNSVADTTGGISTADSMAIPEGDTSAPVKMTVYEDFRCSACGSFESTFHTTYEALVKAGTLEIYIHPVDLIDTMDNSEGESTSGSIHAGNAAACAQDAGHFEAYHDILYANQPQETTDSFSSNTTLINYAKQVPGLNTAAFQTCVNSGKYDNWVKKNYTELNQIDGGQASTPTIYVNGKKYTLPSTGTAAQEQASFTSYIDKLAGVSATASASASASGTSSATATASSSASASATS